MMMISSISFGNEVFHACFLLAHHIARRSLWLLRNEVCVLCIKGINFHLNAANTGPSTISWRYFIANCNHIVSYQLNTHRKHTLFNSHLARLVWLLWVIGNESKSNFKVVEISVAEFIWLPLHNKHNNFRLCFFSVLWKTIYRAAHWK